MAFPDGLLARGERVVLHQHPHWKVLVIPTVLFVVIIAAASFVMTWVSTRADSGLTRHRWWYLGVAAAAVVLLIWRCLAPLLRWRSEHFVLTTHHVLFRTGVLRRRLHQIPLIQVHDVEGAMSFWGRIFRFGSLIVDSSADEPLEFANVASLSMVQGTLNQLLADARGRYHDPDHPPGGPSQGRYEAADSESAAEGSTA